MVSGTIINCADRYLSLLYKRMKEEFLKSHYIHCDEICPCEKKGWPVDKLINPFLFC